MSTMNYAQMPKQEEASSSSAPVVVVKDLHKSFGAQKVLDGINLTLHPAQTMAVLGRSGTGKSVLLRILIGLEQPDSGSVCIKGLEIAGRTLDELIETRKQMGFLFQHGALYDSLTVAENVAFPITHHQQHLSAAKRKERVMYLLEEVGMEAAAKKMPSDISGGMQKRVGLARALALEPEILLLDEPTAGLDPISSSEINELILKLQKEHHIATIVVTHDLHSARTIANRIALLDKGKVVIEGSFEVLQQSENSFVREFLDQS